MMPRVAPVVAHRGALSATAVWAPGGEGLCRLPGTRLRDLGGVGLERHGLAALQAQLVRAAVDDEVALVAQLDAEAGVDLHGGEVFAGEARTRVWRWRQAGHRRILG